jgi:hypothetical protein
MYRKRVSTGVIRFAFCREMNRLYEARRKIRRPKIRRPKDPRSETRTGKSADLGSNLGFLGPLTFGFRHLDPV